MLKKALNRVNPTGGLVYVCVCGGGGGEEMGVGGWRRKKERVLRPS